MRIIAFCFMLLAGTQVFGEDVQVSIDPGGKVPYISNELEKRLNLFPEYRDFREARVFRTDKNTYSLEILYYRNSAVTRKKIVLDEAGFHEFRQKVLNKISETGSMPFPDQEGRYTFLTFTTAFSLLLYGPLTVNILDIDNRKNITGLECVAGSAGFFLPFWMTYKIRVSESSAYSYLYGSLEGSFHGFALNLLINSDNSVSPRQVSSYVLGFALAEGTAGYYLARELHMTTGQADLGASSSLWFTVWTFESLFITTDMDNTRLNGASLLTGSAAGTLLGYYASTCESYSRGDVIVENSAILLGAFIPLGFVDMTGTHRENLFTGASLTGSLAGAAAGYYLVAGKEFSPGEGGLILLGEIAGGLLGAGIAYYILPDNRPFILVSASTGALGGFSAIYYIFHRNATCRHLAENLTIQFNPLGLVRIFSPNQGAGDPDAPGNILRETIPLVTLGYRF
jgi:hypothetical protein